MFYTGQVKAINKIVFDNKIKNDNRNIIGDSIAYNNVASTSYHIRETGKDRIDYDKLFKAVSQAESGGCKSAVATRTNNCVSIMGWKNGKRYIRKFASIEDNKKAFIALWKKSYKTLPNLQLAKCYTNGCKSQGERPEAWLNTVLHYYNN